ncbi:hypothetical protein [Sphingomonas sp. CFBP 8760]|uniref:hypothetical protein n=1 Tax=Sphingomonas sp. CFBP 8760 TaxID=2775282 RepID=UPI001786A935|nr:hypothetical protein [Sphingomonas sp. CFBP 8760]MBD8548167.1 hypothetical protein [Sphingomonas sp. CFBP 8760]
MANAILLTQVKLESFRDPVRPETIRLPAGIFECTGLTIGSNTRLIGAGQGRTVLCPTRGANRPVLVNADPLAGNNHIEIRDITIDGRASDQDRTVNGIQMENVTQSIFDLEVRNCFGSGFLLSGGRANHFGPTMYCHGNGRRSAGYGLYIFGSSGNVVRGGRFNDNCIGIAVEASRQGVEARDNRLLQVQCTANRADFGQSGAGIHFEQSEGGNCDGGVVIDPRCIHSTGVGINNTGCLLRIDGGYCGENREAGIVTIAAIGFTYDGIVCKDNARGNSTGYRSEMRFDDTGLQPGSRGTVTNCRLNGTAPDGGMRTMSRHSAIRFINNKVIGYRFPYIMSGIADLAS